MANSHQKMVWTHRHQPVCIRTVGDNPSAEPSSPCHGCLLNWHSMIILISVMWSWTSHWWWVGLKKLLVVTVKWSISSDQVMGNLIKWRLNPLKDCLSFSKTPKLYLRGISIMQWGLDLVLSKLLKHGSSILRRVQYLLQMEWFHVFV